MSILVLFVRLVPGLINGRPTKMLKLTMKIEIKSWWWCWPWAPFHWTATVLPIWLGHTKRSLCFLFGSGLTHLIGFWYIGSKLQVEDQQKSCILSTACYYLFPFLSIKQYWFRNYLRSPEALICKEWKILPSLIELLHLHVQLLCFEILNTPTQILAVYWCVSLSIVSSNKQ